VNKLARYIIIATGLAIVVFLLWYFINIVAFILVSAVLSLIGKPIVDLLIRIRIRQWHLPRSLAAAAALIVLWALFLLFSG